MTRIWAAVLALVILAAPAAADIFIDSGGGGGVSFGGASGGTATRVLFTDGSGNLADDADLTFVTDTLSATKISVSGTSTLTGAVTAGTTTITVAGTGSSTAGSVNLGFSPSATTGIRYYNDGGGAGLYFDVSGTNLLQMSNSLSLKVRVPAITTNSGGTTATNAIGLNDTNTGFYASANNFVGTVINGAETARVTGTGLKVGAEANPASTLDVAGSFQLPVTSTAPASISTYTLTATDFMVTVDATANALQVDLPTASGITGRMYTIKKIDSSINAVTVDANSSQTIDAATTYVLDDQWDTVSIISNGSNWLIRGRIAAD